METVTIQIDTRASTGGIKAVVTGLEQVKGAAQSASSMLNGIAQRLVGLAAGVVGVTTIGNALKGAVERGVQFNRTVEDARLGIAAILKQFNPQAFRTFDDALKASGDAIDALKKKAVESPASFQQLVQGFQSVTGAATGAGIALNQQVDLVVLMSQALAGLGIRSEQLVQESRALITGNINQDAAAAKILGITKADIDRAREQGRVYEFLSGKLSAFAEAGKISAGNFSTIISNLGDTVQQKLGTITIPIFEALKEGLAALSQAITGTDVEGAFSGWARGLARAVSGFLTLGRVAVENIRLIIAAVEALTLALTVLAVRAALAFGPGFVTQIAAAASWFGVTNAAVAATSATAGKLAGLAAIFKSATGAVSVFTSAFIGWKAGTFLGEIDLLGKGLGDFGIKINDVVTLNILRAMKAWEQFKVSLGKGSPAKVEAIDVSIQELLVPPTQKTAPKSEAAVSKQPPALVDAIEHYRLILEQNATRIALIEKEITIDAAQRSAELKAVYEERALSVANLKSELEKGVPETFGTDDEGVRFTRDYSEASRELNALLKEQAEIKATIAKIERDDAQRRIGEIDQQIEREALRNQTLRTEGATTPDGRTVGSLTDESARIKESLNQTRELIQAREKLRETLAASEDTEARALAGQMELQNARDLLQIQEQLVALKEQTNDFTFFEKLGRNLDELQEKTRNVGAAIADVLTNGVGDAISGVANGMWSVIDGTARWGDVFISVGRRIISNMLEIVLTQGLVRGAMMLTAAVAEAVGAKQIAQSIRAFTASAIAGAGKSGEQGGWVGLLIYLGVLAATIGAIGAMAGGFERGGIITGGEQLIRVNERGTESVLNARATQMLGVDTINALNAGIAMSLEPPSDPESQRGWAANMAAVESRGGSSAQPAPEPSERPELKQTIVLVDNRNDLLRTLESAEGTVKVIEIVRANKTEIGIS